MNQVNPEKIWKEINLFICMKERVVFVEKSEKKEKITFVIEGYSFDKKKDYEIELKLVYTREKDTENEIYEVEVKNYILSSNGGFYVKGEENDENIKRGSVKNIGVFSGYGATLELGLNMNWIPGRYDLVATYEDKILAVSPFRVELR